MSSSVPLLQFNLSARKKVGMKEEKEEGGMRARQKASVLMIRLSYPTETVLSNKVSRNRIVLSFKDSPRTPL